MSSSVVDRALKCLSEKVGATPSRVAQMVPDRDPLPAVADSWGAKLSVPKGGSKTGEGFRSFLPSERVEKRVHPDFNVFEESLVVFPAHIALGAG